MLVSLCHKYATLLLICKLFLIIEYEWQIICGFINFLRTYDHIAKMLKPIWNLFWFLSCGELLKNKMKYYSTANVYTFCLCLRNVLSIFIKSWVRRSEFFIAILLNANNTKSFICKILLKRWSFLILRQVLF